MHVWVPWEKHFPLSSLPFAHAINLLYFWKSMLKHSSADRPTQGLDQGNAHNTLNVWTRTCEAGTDTQTMLWNFCISSSALLVWNCHFSRPTELPCTTGRNTHRAFSPNLLFPQLTPSLSPADQGWCKSLFLIWLNPGSNPACCYSGTNTEWLQLYSATSEN